MQKTLFEDDYVVLVSQKIASVLGTDKAYILQQIHYWIEVTKEKANNSKDDHHFQNNRWWIYNTYKEWGEQFKFCAPRTVRKYIDELVNAGILIKGCFNKRGFDRTSWYSIDYDVSIFSILFYGYISSP